VESDAQMPLNDCPGTAATVFRARESELRAILDHVKACAQDLHLPRNLQLRLCLVVEELFVNTARYGGGDGAEASVELAADVDGVELRYVDTALPFNPLDGLAVDALTRPVEQRPIGGLGRILVRELSSAARYAREDGRNVLRLRFEGA
jgi:anti-sigma regulatory factor (Ser/Thr protein kinase)